MTVIPELMLNHFTKNSNGVDSAPVELMVTNENQTTALVCYRSSGVNKAGNPYDYFTLGRAYFDRRFAAWGIGYGQSLGVVPFTMRDQFLMVMVQLALDHGVITGAVGSNGAKLSAVKPVKKAANGHTKPVTQVSAPPFEASTVAAAVKPARKRGKAAR